MLLACWQCCFSEGLHCLVDCTAHRQRHQPTRTMFFVDTTPFSWNKPTGWFHWPHQGEFYYKIFWQSTPVPVTPSDEKQAKHEHLVECCIVLFKILHILKIELYTFGVVVVSRCCKIWKHHLKAVFVQRPISCPLCSDEVSQYVYHTHVLKPECGGREGFQFICCFLDAIMYGTLVQNKGIQRGDGRKSELRGASRRYSNQLATETASRHTLWWQLQRRAKQMWACPECNDANSGTRTR